MPPGNTITYSQYTMFNSALRRAARAPLAATARQSQCAFASTLSEREVKLVR